MRQPFLIERPVGPRTNPARPVSRSVLRQYAPRHSLFQMLQRRNQHGTIRQTNRFCCSRTGQRIQRFTDLITRRAYDRLQNQPFACSPCTGLRKSHADIAHLPRPIAPRPVAIRAKSFAICSRRGWIRKGKLFRVVKLFQHSCNPRSVRLKIQEIERVQIHDRIELIIVHIPVVVKSRLFAPVTGANSGKYLLILCFCIAL